MQGKWDENEVYKHNRAKYYLWSNPRNATTTPSNQNRRQKGRLKRLESDLKVYL